MVFDLFAKGALGRPSALDRPISLAVHVLFAVLTVSSPPHVWQTTRHNAGANFETAK